MALPRVSVVLTFWNEVQFLPEAIKSVMAQTYRDWELLLVDDGSTDGSSQIARNYAKMDSERVRYLEHENHQNLGISALRNLGNRAARGNSSLPWTATMSGCRRSSRNICESLRRTPMWECYMA